MGGLYLNVEGASRASGANVWQWDPAKDGKSLKDDVASLWRFDRPSDGQKVLAATTGESGRVGPFAGVCVGAAMGAMIAVGVLIVHSKRNTIGQAQLLG